MNQKQFEQEFNDLVLFGGMEDEANLSRLIAVLKHADDVYSNSQGEESAMTDADYDSIKLFAERFDPANPYFLAVGSEVRGDKVKLPYPMGSLTQAQLGGELESWTAKHDSCGAGHVVMDKLDGLSGEIIFTDGQLRAAFTRGDGYEGTDITRHVRKMKNVPQTVPMKGTFAVRVELIFRKDALEQVREISLLNGGRNYRNLRNAAAGIMNRETNPQGIYDLLHAVAYQIFGSSEGKLAQLLTLSSLGFEVVECELFDGINLNDDNMTDFTKARLENSLYELDGVVIEVESGDLRSKINPSKDTLNPEYARKFKISTAGNYAEVEVKSVDWNPSKHGYAKPRVNFDACELEGALVQFATGFNAKFIVDNNIGPGAVISVVRSGGVIPFITGVIKPAHTLVLPKGTSWNATKVDLVYDDVSTMDEVVIQSNTEFFKSLGIDFVGEGTVTQLYNAGLTTVESILTASEGRLIQALGSTPIGEKVFNSIEHRLSQPIFEYELAGATTFFGRGIGVRKLKALFEATTDIHFHDALNSAARIVAVDKFDEKTAMKITSGVAAYKKFYNVVHHLFTFKQFVKLTGKWEGKTVVFTGIRDKNAEAKIVNAGGKIGSSVSAKTTYVVAADPTSNSGKASKAFDLGIPVISIEELREML